MREDSDLEMPKEAILVPWRFGVERSVSRCDSWSERLWYAKA